MKTGMIWGISEVLRLETKSSMPSLLFQCFLAFWVAQEASGIKLRAGLGRGESNGAPACGIVQAGNRS